MKALPAISGLTSKGRALAIRSPVLVPIQKTDRTPRWTAYPLQGRFYRKTAQPQFSPLQRALAWYSRRLDTHPLLTKGITSGLIAGSGDVVAQFIEHSADMGEIVWDAQRTGRFGFLGLALVAPVIHVWYRFLMGKFPGTEFVRVTQRVAVDQLMFAPLFLTSFVSSLWMLEGIPPRLIPGMLRDHIPSAVVANWSLWIPSQIINFRFVPGKFQVLFSNVVALGWNVYLSFASHRAQQEGRIPRSASGTK